MSLQLKALITRRSILPNRSWLAFHGPLWLSHVTHLHDDLLLTAVTEHDLPRLIAERYSHVQHWLV